MIAPQPCALTTREGGWRSKLLFRGFAFSCLVPPDSKQDVFQMGVILCHMCAVELTPRVCRCIPLDGANLKRKGRWQEALEQRLSCSLLPLHIWRCLRSPEQGEHLSSLLAPSEGPMHLCGTSPMALSVSICGRYFSGPSSTLYFPC